MLKYLQKDRIIDLIRLALIALLLTGCAITPADKLRLDDGRMIARPAMKPIPALPEHVRNVGIEISDPMFTVAGDAFRGLTYSQLNAKMAPFGPLTTPPSLTKVIHAYLTAPTIPPAGADDASDHLRWLKWRIQALNQLGFIRSAVELYLSAPSDLADEDLIFLGMDSMARLNQIEAACLESLIHLRRLQTARGQQYFELCQWVIDPDTPPFLVHGISKQNKPDTPDTPDAPRQSLRQSLGQFIRDIKNSTRNARITPDTPAFLRHVMLRHGYTIAPDTLAGFLPPDLIAMVMDDAINKKTRHMAARLIYKNDHGLPDSHATANLINMVVDHPDMFNDMSINAPLTAVAKVTATNNPLEKAMHLADAFETTVKQPGPWMTALVDHLAKQASDIPLHDNFNDQAGILALLHYYNGDAAGARQWMNQFQPKDTENSGSYDGPDTRYRHFVQLIEQLLNSGPVQNQGDLAKKVDKKYPMLAKRIGQTDFSAYHNDQAAGPPFQQVIDISKAWQQNVINQADWAGLSQFFSHLNDPSTDFQARIALDILIISIQYRN